MYLRKVSKVTDIPTNIEVGSIFINSLSWFPNNVIRIEGETINLYEITPYHLKNEQNQLFENIWQFSKIYSHVYQQHQVYLHKVTWSHPAQSHMNDDGSPTEEYWSWREKGFNNPYPVRYPNGFSGRHECKGLLLKKDDGCLNLSEARIGEYQNSSEARIFGYRNLGYIDSRKEVYCRLYKKLATKTTAFKQLRKLAEKGYSFTFCDIDVPPTFLDKVNHHNYNEWLNNPNIPFGHTWTLAKLLLVNIDSDDDEEKHPSIKLVWEE